jgi:hypothetical protein
MNSTLPYLAALLPLLGLSDWIRTDLILAATLVFLVLASWATLMAARPLPPRRSGAPDQSALVGGSVVEPIAASELPVVQDRSY